MQTMAETATETIDIAAPLDRVWTIATDLENYPVWTHDVKDVVITSRDGALSTSCRLEPVKYPSGFPTSTPSSRSQAS